jgi:hypothetical protein
MGNCVRRKEKITKRVSPNPITRILGETVSIPTGGMLMAVT